MAAENCAQARQLLRLMPAVAGYQEAFAAQNKRLTRTTLTGKISSLQNASTLFEFMENTQQSFGALQERLIAHLLEENLAKAVLEARSRAQCAIDILVRNLYERTADIGFLATDETLLAFLADRMPEEGEKSRIKNRLREYVRKYTVYTDVLLLRPDGSVAARLGEGCALVNRDGLTQAALESGSYVERFAPFDLVPGSSRSLVYAGRMGPPDQPLGVLALVFDFEGEMRRIFERLGGVLALCDERHRVIAASRPELTAPGMTLPCAKEGGYAMVRLGAGAYVSADARTKGYEGYFGLPWSVHGLVLPEQTPLRTDEAPGRYRALLSAQLREIVEQSVEIGEDLGDVVINGELITSKARAYALNPILENIRAIGDQIRGIFMQALGDLEQTVAASLFSEAALLADLSLDIMDRNLYERANDCRWWALSDHFRNALASGAQQADRQRMAEVLAYINGLYTVYALLFVYDAQGEIVAVSKPSGAAFTGKRIEGDAVRQALHNKDPQRYFVSPFEPSPFYGGRATYICHASITDPAAMRTVGGIGIVFDAAPQFEAILRDTLPLDQNGQTIAGAFNLFADDGRRVIASTRPAHASGGELPFDAAQFPAGKTVLAEFEGRSYLVASARSGGYREYKNNDGYVNAVRAFTFVPV